MDKIFLIFCLAILIFCFAFVIMEIRMLKKRKEIASFKELLHLSAEQGDLECLLIYLAMAILIVLLPLISE